LACGPWHRAISMMDGFLCQARTPRPWPKTNGDLVLLAAGRLPGGPGATCSACVWGHGVARASRGWEGPSRLNERSRVLFATTGSRPSDGRTGTALRAGRLLPSGSTRGAAGAPGEPGSGAGSCCCWWPARLERLGRLGGGWGLAMAGTAPEQTSSGLGFGPVAARPGAPVQDQACQPPRAALHGRGGAGLPTPHSPGPRELARTAGRPPPGTPLADPAGGRPWERAGRQ